MNPGCDLDPFYAHGGRVAAARAAFGGDDWIDLSTGIAPWAWPVAGVAPRLARLPEPEEIAGLEAAAGQVFGVADPTTVVAVPGTDLAMRLLAPILGARRPAVVRPGYSGHAAAWPNAAAVTHDRLGDLAGHDLVVLATPANPDGQIAAPAVLHGVAQRMTLVVDEAYGDPAAGLCPQASDRLVVLRSFGKFYGLPGLRLGFVMTGPGVAGRLRAVLGDWPVSGPAVAIGTAAYRDTGWREAQTRRIAGAGVSLDQLLADAGIALAGTAPLFRLIACDAAADLFRTLARHAILTRPLPDQPDRLRIGLPRDAAALTRLATALKEYTR